VLILFVEDDPLIREIIVEALREERYDVIHACHGEEALA
jgi:CheY-like chemotaxis protein